VSKDAPAISWKVTALTNGLRVVTTPVATAQSVSVNIFIGAGSRCEPRERQGLAHFLEHMLFKGSQRRANALLIASAIEGAGGTLNAYTGKELTCYWNLLPYEKLDLAIDVLADMACHPLLDEGEIEREKSVVQQEIFRTHDQPAAWVMELLTQAIFGGDEPMGWSIAGSPETVAAIGREDFLSYLATWYRPANIVVSVAGNVEHEAVVEQVAPLLDVIEGPTPPLPPLDGPPPLRRVAVEERPTAQAHLALALMAFPRNDPDRYTLTVLNSLLGRGMSSRLFREVRERRGLAYSIGSSISRYSDTGLLTITAGVGSDNVKEALAVIVAEVERLAQELTEEEELAKARDYTVGSFRLSLETTMALGQWTGESLLALGEIEPPEEVVAKLRAVSAEDTQRVAQRLLSSGLALSAVGPQLREEEMAEFVRA